LVFSVLALRGERAKSLWERKVKTEEQVFREHKE